MITSDDVCHYLIFYSIFYSNARQRDLMQGLNSCQNKDPEMGFSNSESLLTNQL